MSGFDPRMMQGAMPGGGQPPMGGGGMPPGGGQRYQPGGGQMGGQGGGQQNNQMGFMSSQLQNRMGRKDPREALIQAQWSGNPMQIAAAQLAVQQWEEQNSRDASMFAARHPSRPTPGGGSSRPQGQTNEWMQAMMQQIMGGGGGSIGGSRGGGSGIGGGGGYV